MDISNHANISRKKTCENGIGESSVIPTWLDEPPTFPRKLQQRQLHGITQRLNMLLEHDLSIICYFVTTVITCELNVCFFFSKRFVIVINVCWCIDYQGK